VAVENSLGKLPAAHDAILAWAVHEGVTNVIRHSGGTHCTIKLARNAGEAILEITDNGASANGPVRPGSGLRGLEERVTVLGGAVSAGSGPNGQFRLRVSLPLTTWWSSRAALSP
jgi:two-component system sensor histidine kinase DesK